MDKQLELFVENEIMEQYPYSLEIMLIVGGNKRFLSFFYTDELDMVLSLDDIYSTADKGMSFATNAKTWLDCMEYHEPKTYAFAYDKIVSIEEVYG